MIPPTQRFPRLSQSKPFSASRNNSPPLGIAEVSSSLSALTVRNNESSICTSQIPFQPSTHGQLRRFQRDIGIRDLQKAIKYGSRSRGYPDQRTGNPRSVYNYQGICYVVDDVTGREVTSFSPPTKLLKKKLSPEELRRHDEAQIMLNNVPSCLMSHTVLLVDKSGSMRQTDVTDSRSRYQSVWIAVAIDFIKYRIDTGQATEYDAISIVLVGDEPHVLVSCVPTDWVLFNHIVDIYDGYCFAPSVKKRLLTPCGHGNFLPALKVANGLLERKAPHSSATLALAILSDGRPSDFNGNWVSARKYILECVENIAAKFGKRLSVHGIGMGSADKFELLREVTTVVKEYSCQAEFYVPGLSAVGLGAAFSSLATSVTESVMAGGPKPRLMRPVSREKASNVPFLTEAVDSTEFDIYMGANVSRAV
jgi:hypothetical protein